jgi:MFS family permease
LVSTEGERSAHGAGAREEFRRAWLPLLTAFVGVALGHASLNAHTQGAFMLPLTREFGWTRAEISVTAMITGIVGLPTALVLGSLIDRFGPRVLASVSIFGTAAAFWMMSLTGQNIAFFYFAVGFLVVGGAGTSAITYVSLVNWWFDRARGLAIGIVMSASGVMGMLAPKLMIPYIARAGWRAGYRALAIATLVSLPVILLGAVRPRRAAAEGAARPAHGRLPHGAGALLWGMTLREALRTRRFWKQGLAFFLMACALLGVYHHFVPMLLDAGLTPERAANVAASFGLAVFVGRLVAGVLLDRFFAPYLGVCFVLVAASGMAALMLPGEGWLTWTALAIGLAFGTELDIAGYMCARYYGTRAYGSIYAWQFSMFTTGAILSPILYGFVHDRTDSYGWALLVSGALMLGAIPLFLSLGEYATPGASSAGGARESSSA